MRGIQQATPTYVHSSIFVILEDFFACFPKCVNSGNVDVEIVSGLGLYNPSVRIIDLVSKRKYENISSATFSHQISGKSSESK